MSRSSRHRAHVSVRISPEEPPAARVMRDGEGATAEEMALSRGTVTLGLHVDDAAGQRTLDGGRNADGSCDCWRCGYTWERYVCGTVTIPLGNTET